MGGVCGWEEGEGVRMHYATKKLGKSLREYTLLYICLWGRV